MTPSNVPMMTDDSFQTICTQLYANAKQSEQECKCVGCQPWSRMMATTGKMVQYANEEFRCWRNHKASNPMETNASAFACAHHNQMEAYAELGCIKAHAAKL